MKALATDTDFPTQITPEEEQAGFKSQPINPDVGIPMRAVILVLGEKHRIVKMRDLLTQEIVYVHQMKRLHDGQLFFSEACFYTDLQTAIGFGRFTSEFGRCPGLPVSLRAYMPRKL